MSKSPMHRVLVAVDFGDASARAIDIASAIARQTGASLCALHAESVDVPVYFTSEQLDTIAGEQRAGRARARQFLADHVRGRTTAPFEAVVVEGSPTDAVLDAGRDADLIVMGTHGRRGPGRWWLGSVAERVVRAADVPVLVVRADAGPRGENVFERLLVLAGADASAATRRQADALAEAFGGVVEIGPPPETWRVATVEGATLVVVELHPAGQGDRRIDDAVIRLLRQCPVPVLFVPAGER